MVIFPYRNGVLHEKKQGHIARYKVEALQRKIEAVWGRYNGAWMQHYRGISNNVRSSTI
jgi:hypothetical protein